jgi:voltage-gated sodium channel
MFQNTTLFIIVLNAIWIFIDVEANHANLKDSAGKTPLQPASDVIENLFCVYFTIEVLIRFLAFKKLLYAVKDPWFVFDSTLVLFMVIETWILPIIAVASGEGNSGSNVLSNFSNFRLLRLLRLTRMARIMRFFPELMTLVKGMVRAMQSVIFILLFLIIITYVFAIIFTSQLGEPSISHPADLASTPDVDSAYPADAPKELFADLGSSMLTLFTNGVLGDNLADTLHQVKSASVLLFWLFIVFMVISGITLLNMLIGVLCQVITDSSQEEEEERQIMDRRNDLVKAFKMTDLSADGEVSVEEWDAIKQNKDLKLQLTKLGIKEDQIDDRLDKLREDLFGTTHDELQGGEPGEPEITGLSFEDFADHIMEMRMDTPAGVLDVETLRATVHVEDTELVKRLEQLEATIQKAMGIEATEIPAPPESNQELQAEVQLPGQTERSEEAPSTWPGDNWIQAVPTELLCHVLKARASAS